MRKKSRRSYTCVTLFKQDIKELQWLFQTHLQDIEFVMDGNHIPDIAQLDQFGPAYQVQSLVVRGYYHEMQEEHRKPESEPLLVELKMSKIVAVLIIWKEASEAEPEFIADIKKLLLRHLNRVNQFLILCSAFSTLYPFVTLQSVGQQHHLDFLPQLLLELGGIPLGLATLGIFITIVHLLKLDTRVFLFPGAMETTRTYGRGKAIGTMVVAVVTTIVVQSIVIIASNIFWQ